MLHKNQPLEFLSLTRQEAGTATWASRVLQFNQQMEGDSEKVRASSQGAECPLGAGHGARCSSKLQRTPALALLAGWSWGSPTTSLNFKFIIYQMGIALPSPLGHFAVDSGSVGLGLSSHFTNVETEAPRMAHSFLNTH